MPPAQNVRQFESLPPFAIHVSRHASNSAPDSSAEGSAATLACPGVGVGVGSGASPHPSAPARTRMAATHMADRTERFMGGLIPSPYKGRGLGRGYPGEAAGVGWDLSC